jgi:DinB superfamily
VLTDAGAMDEMLAFGPRQLPIVSIGKRWVNGQSLKAVADLVGIELGEIKHLPPAELARRTDLILDGASRFFAQIPDANLGDELPGRPRSFLQLTWHLFNVADALLEHENGIPLTNMSYNRNPAGETTRAQVLDYGADVRRRYNAWFETARNRTDWADKAQVFYGDVTRHEYLERTTWHTGQHARQLMWILERLGITPDQPLPAEMWVGLPMPEKVWDS